MEVDNEDIKKALKIKNAIQNYLEQIKEVNIRSTDIFPYLVRRGLFKPDKHNGLYFRRFLKKLYQANMLQSLIPQCKYIPGINGEIFGEWYFNSHTVNVGKLKTLTDKNDPDAEEVYEKKPIIEIQDIDTANDVIWNLLEGKHPLTHLPLKEVENNELIMVQKSLQLIMKGEEEIKNHNKKEIRETRYKSTSALSEKMNISSKKLFEIFENRKWITRNNDYWVLTKLGEEKGGKMKKSQYGEYIAWPEEKIIELKLQNI